MAVLKGLPLCNVKEEFFFLSCAVGLRQKKLGKEVCQMDKMKKNIVEL